MFNLIHKNKKGLSLAELLVTIVILGMLISLGGQILYQLTRFYNMASMRWEIQSAVQLACNRFETNRDSISNAYQADILYDPKIAEGIIYDDTNNTFEWKNGSPYVLPAENAVDSEDPYTYMFSTPAYRKSDGQYLGSFLFIRDYASSNSTLFLEDAGFGDTPVEITFDIGRSVDAIDSSGNIDNTIPDTYLTQTVAITLKSGRQDVTNYEVKTAFTLVNISEGKKINYSNGVLVFDPSWMVGASGTTPMAGPAGWTDAELNEQIGSGFPGNSTYYTVEETNTNIMVTVDTVKQSGNIMRFVSPTAFHEKGDVDELTSSANMASCLTSFAFSDSSKLSSHALGALRDFRDNVLKGTTMGDWVINNYYNEWSPFLVQKMSYLKPVYKVILTPVAYICGLIANI